MLGVDGRLRWHCLSVPESSWRDDCSERHANQAWQSPDLEDKATKNNLVHSAKISVYKSGHPGVRLGAV